MNKIMIFILFFFVSITWGTTWIAMKIAIETIPPLCATGMRFLLAFPLLIILCYFNKSPLLFPNNNRWFQIFISIFYFSIPFGLMLYGGSYVNSLISSMIFANMPVAILIVSNIFLRKKLFLMQKLGIFTSIITLFIILFYELKRDFLNQFPGILSLLFALLSHAVIYVQCQKKCYNISILTFHTLSSLISSLLLLSVSYFLEHPNIYAFSLKSIFSVLYLAYFPGVFGMLSYFYLQKKVNSFYASIVFLIFPFISGYLEYYFYQDNFHLFKIYFIFPLMLGLLLTLIPAKKYI